MLINFFKDYARLIIFAGGMLIGVQVPNFIDQYAKRISAHYLEAKENFSGYQNTADKHFGGSVDALLGHYESSNDTVFEDDSKNIKYIYHRIQSFSSELKALDKSFLKRIFHVAFHSDQQVLEETYHEYSYTVPLNEKAIVCGLLLGLISSLVFEFLFFGIIKICLIGRDKRLRVRARMT